MGYAAPATCALSASSDKSLLSAPCETVGETLSCQQQAADRKNDSQGILKGVEWKEFSVMAETGNLPDVFKHVTLLRCPFSNQG